MTAGANPSAWLAAHKPVAAAGAVAGVAGLALWRKKKGAATPTPSTATPATLDNTNSDLASQIGDQFATLEGQIGALQTVQATNNTTPAGGGTTPTTTTSPTPTVDHGPAPNMDYINSLHGVIAPAPGPNVYGPPGDSFIIGPGTGSTGAFIPPGQNIPGLGMSSDQLRAALHAQGIT